MLTRPHLQRPARKAFCLAPPHLPLQHIDLTVEFRDLYALRERVAVHQAGLPPRRGRVCPYAVLPASSHGQAAARSEHSLVARMT